MATEYLISNFFLTLILSLRPKDATKSNNLHSDSPHLPKLILIGWERPKDATKPNGIPPIIKTKNRINLSNNNSVVPQI